MKTNFIKFFKKIFQKSRIIKNINLRTKNQSLPSENNDTWQ